MTKIVLPQYSHIIALIVWQPKTQPTSFYSNKRKVGSNCCHKVNKNKSLGKRISKSKGKYCSNSTPATSGRPSVLVDAKEPDLVELRQLRDEHKQERTEVDGKMNRVVLGIEAREEK